MEDVKVIELKSGVDLPQDKKFIEYSTGSVEMALKMYEFSFQVRPKEVYRWAWIIFIEEPGIKDLPLFSE